MSAVHEEDDEGGAQAQDGGRSRAKPGSMPYVPPVAGMIMAGLVLRRLAEV